MINEEELVIAAQSGDNEAFQKLVSSYSGSLYKIGYYYLKDRQDTLETSLFRTIL